MNGRLLAERYMELNLQCVRELKGSDCDLPLQEIRTFAILYCRSGGISLTVDDRSFDLNENDIFLVYPNQTLSVKSGYYSCIYIEFGGIVAKDLIERTRFLNGPEIMHDADMSFGMSIHRLYTCFRETGYLNIKCLGIFYELMFDLIQETDIPEAELKRPIRHVDAAKTFIETNYAKDITISDVAKAAHVTVNYLSGIFVAECGMTPKRYLTFIRMEQAKNLLLTKKYKVGEVSLRVGYKNPLHFSAEFRKYAGVSPLQYMEQNP